MMQKQQQYKNLQTWKKQKKLSTKIFKFPFPERNALSEILNVSLKTQFVVKKEKITKIIAKVI